MKRTIQQVSLIIGLIITTQANAQISYTSNSFGTATDYVGWDNTNNFPLEIRHNGNFPINTYTNTTHRMKINPDLTTTINSVTQSFSGFVGIAPNGYFANNTPITLLHLIGPDNSGYGIGGGWRRWMSTGIFINEHSDGMYIGMKPVIGATNRSNAVINWNDDPFTGSVDKLSFVFTQANGNGNGTGTNPINSNSLSGYEFMLMAPSTTVYNSQGTGEGTIGVGPVFSDALPPQSRFHMNAEERMNNWFQISNQTGTGQTANDGLRVGINGNANINMNGNALIYNQETRHLLFSTASNTNTINFNTGTTLERMRITSISAPTNLVGGGYGIHNPGGLNGNLTRVAISHDQNNPVTRPLSLLHLGYNTPTANNDGWRNWMDVGIFTSNATHSMYMGLKNEGTAKDAVVNWGSDSLDNLRFIFTENPSSTNPHGGLGANGLEIARIEPKVASTLTTSNNYGMMGIGNFSPTGPNTAPADVVDAKLDIDGDLRIRQVRQTDLFAQVLVIDSTDHNRVYWRDINEFGLGNYCSDPQNPLTGNYEIPLDNNNFLLSDLFGTGQILMGDVDCSNTTDARVYIRNNSTTSSLPFGLKVESNGSGSTGGYFYGEEYGIYAQSAYAPGTSYAGWFEGDVYINSPTGLSGAGVVMVSDQLFKTNIDTIANATNIIQQLSPKTFFFDTVSTPQIKFGSERQYGFIAQEVELILPELVSEHTFPAQYDSLGNQTSAAINYKGLNYNAFIAILMKGMQDQQESLNNKDSIINNLNDRLTSLENCLSGILPLLCQLSNASVQENDETTQKQLINELKVILEDNQNIVLEQNAPNPFAEQTVINYFIPEAVQQAEIVFYNLGGEMIQTVNLTEKGNGKLTVYGNDLSSGTYTYSLIADGKLIATKKMVKK